MSIKVWVGTVEHDTDIPEGSYQEVNEHGVLCWFYNIDCAEDVERLFKTHQRLILDKQGRTGEYFAMFDLRCD